MAECNVDGCDVDLGEARFALDLDGAGRVCPECWKHKQNQGEWPTHDS